MDRQNSATNKYRQLVTVLLILEVILITGLSSFFLIYSIPKSMYVFLFSSVLDAQGIGFEGETLALFAYIVTIAMALFLFWVFVYRVAFYKHYVINKFYYIGLVVWLVNLIVVYLLDTIATKFADGADTLGALSTGSIILIHLKHLAPFAFVYLHFTLLYILRRKYTKG